jgi:uncharacterized protein
MGIMALAAAIAAASPAAASLPDAEPAIFQVADGDTRVYIFGTFHALDGKPDWFNDDVRTAFEQSGELVLETVIPEPAAGPAFAGPPPPLPGPQVTTSASFLGTTKMAIRAGKSQGLSVAHGADMVLRRAADDVGKPVEGLETLESQLAMFARMPATAPSKAAPGERPAEQRSMPALSKAMVEMQNAWKRGDQAIFVQMIDQLRRSSPDLYRMMFAERNSRWADWIAARMQTPGTVFVAVGAGHLAGKDSVLVRLAEMGIESSRLN